MLLQDKVAVITGGTAGLGLGIAEAFLREGAKVVLNGRRADKGEKIVADLGAGDRAVFRQGDVLKKEDIESLVDFAVEHFGRIDIMVNNAGGTAATAPVVDVTDEDWDLNMKWNLYSTFYGPRRALKHMIPQQWGRIINMSSVESKMANKPMVSHYITNKHAMNGLTKATAYEYAQQGITCNAICPGAVETDLMKEVGPLVAQQSGTTYEEFLQSYANESMIKRLTTVEEVAACAVWLASEPGGGVTGAMINVDGGTSPW